MATCAPLLNHIHVRDVLELAHYLADHSLYRDISLEHFKSMLYYVEEAGNVSDHKAFIQCLEQQLIDPEYKETMQTVANALRSEMPIVG